MNKTSLNHLQIHTFTFKNVIFTTAKYEMYLRILHKLCFPGCIFSKQAKPGRKQGWILRRTISHRKVFLCPQKENWAFFWTFPFLQRRILNLEQRETLALVKKFDIGLSFGDGVHRELNRHVRRTRLIICFICKACREGCYILLYEMRLRQVFTVKTAIILLTSISEFEFNRARSILYGACWRKF